MKQIFKTPESEPIIVRPKYTPDGYPYYVSFEDWKKNPVKVQQPKQNEK